MHRSLFLLLRKQINIGLCVRTCENGRLCVSKTPNRASASAVHNSLHTSAVSLTTGDDDRPKPKKTRVKKIVGLTDEKQLESAAVDAAKSLPGDWTRIADDLMARLSLSGESQPESEDSEPSPVAKSSLLSTMKLGRGFERTKTHSDSGDSLGQEVGYKKMMRKRLARKSETFTSLYSQPPLGIFDANKLKAEDGKTDYGHEGSDQVSLWQVVANEKMQSASHGLPSNGFEEMIQWTKEGRMWTFPVDNEEHMEEERKYKFHEHVFLQHHLGAFPSDGPLRRFMDLVILGLSKNPWVSVEEKVEHIQWYANYFREKQQLLEASIGDKAKLKQSESGS